MRSLATGKADGLVHGPRGDANHMRPRVPPAPGRRGLRPRRGHSKQLQRGTGLGQSGRHSLEGGEGGPGPAAADSVLQPRLEPGCHSWGGEDWLAGQVGAPDQADHRHRQPRLQPRRHPTLNITTELPAQTEQETGGVRGNEICCQGCLPMVRLHSSRPCLA